MIFNINYYLLLLGKKNSVFKRNFKSRSFPDLDPDPKLEMRIWILQMIPDPIGSGSDTGTLLYVRVSIARQSR